MENSQTLSQHANGFPMFDEGYSSNQGNYNHADKETDLASFVKHCPYHSQTNQRQSEHKFQMTKRAEIEDTTVTK